jgi:hypothetical protein
MASSESSGYAISLPAGWLRLPGSTDTESSIQEIVDSFEVSEDVGDRLRFALRNVNSISLEAPGRANYALIRAPDDGRVDAVMAVSFPRQTADSLADYREAAHSVARDPQLDQVERTVNEYPLPAGPSIVVHEFVLPRTDGGVSDPAVERAVLALFPDGFESFFEFSLVTQDLTVFDDAAEYLLAVAAEVRFSTEGATA